jgi:hypothetical protein
MNRFQALLTSADPDDEIQSMTLVIYAENQDLAESIADDAAESLKRLALLDLDSCWELA